MNSDKKFIPLSGTFIDAIACDIPSNNWTPDIWEREFARYNEIGIDEAYIIRVGWQESSCYKSDVMKTTLYNDTDMVQLLLDLGVQGFVGFFAGAEGFHQPIRAYIFQHIVNGCYAHFYAGITFPQQFYSILFDHSNFLLLVVWEEYLQILGILFTGLQKWEWDE